MEHQSDKNIYLPNRLGFHYFPDADHYGQKHINQWLPIFQQMKIGWLVLHSPLTHAIPEDFIRPLAEAEIRLIVDFQHPLNQDPDWSAIGVLLSAYGKWGTSFAILDRNANLRDSWGSSRWGNPDLIKVYADQFLKFSGLALENAIHPVLGPLVPGGDYWDSAFLKILLSEIGESASAIIRNNFALSTYGWTQNRPLDWGSGGPVAWPAAGAYQKSSAESQNQQGFRSYEWVDAAAHTVFGRSLPVILLEAGIHSRIGDYQKKPAELSDQIDIVGLINGRNVYSKEHPNNLLAPLPTYIKSANFFVLSSKNPDHESLCWFQENGQRLPPAQAFYVREGLIDRDSETKDPPISPHLDDDAHEFTYHRYFLISKDLMPSAAEILESLHQVIEMDKPMVGFSPDDACQAAAITYITNDSEVNPGLMQILGSRGSLIRIIHPQDISTWIRENNYEIV
jgi:hypothetical protein